MVRNRLPAQVGLKDKYFPPISNTTFNVQSGRQIILFVYEIVYNTYNTNRSLNTIPMIEI